MTYRYSAAGAHPGEHPGLVASSWCSCSHKEKKGKQNPPLACLTLAPSLQISNEIPEEISFRIQQEMEVGFLQPAAVSVYEYYDSKSTKVANSLLSPVPKI